MSYEEYSRTIKSWPDWSKATRDVDGLRNYRKVYTELFPHNDDNGNIKENPEISFRAFPIPFLRLSGNRFPAG